MPPSPGPASAPTQEAFDGRPAPAWLRVFAFILAPFVIAFGLLVEWAARSGRRHQDLRRCAKLARVNAALATDALRTAKLLRLRQALGEKVVDSEIADADRIAEEAQRTAAALSDAPRLLPLSAYCMTGTPEGDDRAPIASEGINPNG